MTRHLHLDITGGIAGDMFLAAMLFAFPDARQKLEADLKDAGLADKVRMEPVQIREKGFAALRMDVSISADTGSRLKTWQEIRRELENSKLTPEVCSRAIAIFQMLAEAEAACHDVSVEDVHFHELSDWDSIADVVGAASVIEFAKSDFWSVSLLPLGRGRAKTQHGLVPVPAPAAAELLKGFSFVDDGGAGERITPTGAAILRYLAPTQSVTGSRGELRTTGTGAGTMQIDGIPNLLRVLCFDAAPASAEIVNMIRFEIDDMTPEELAVSLDRLRAVDGVLDAGQVTGFGKKGRPQFSVSVMTRPECNDEIVERCFSETSTLGLRVETVVRHVLARQEEKAGTTRIKTARRPHGVTAKAESDDLTEYPTLKERRARARFAETVDE